MNHLTAIQSDMFAREDDMRVVASVFEALSSACRVEIVYLLSRAGFVASGEIARLTNCAPSQVSQYLARMLDAGIVRRRRAWRTVEYSLDYGSPIVSEILRALDTCFQK